MSESRGFDRLHEKVQRWVWAQGWIDLRDIQEQAIAPILSADCDVILSASTAAGKTEAAFLPVCSLLAEHSPKGIGLLYISPLKALINDQYRRLHSLCKILDIPLTPWHGDVLRSLKDRQRKDPRGILLITPESFESLLLNQKDWCVHALGQLSHVIVDEFHAFLGAERGCQLQSLLHRLEFLLQRIVPRIALSATLGDMRQVAHYLRPDGKLPHKIIESKLSRSDLKIQLRGYLASVQTNEDIPSVLQTITDDLYEILRGKSHLVFANSRGRTEGIAVALSDHCERDGVPNEFFPHHGSLSKDIRESLEKRLQKEKLPTTAVCTMTLELGIDIGSVDSIAQVTAPHSVASLRQRLGRSGRRGDPSILRLFIQEDEISAKSHLLDRLRLETFQCVAMINLLLKKWYEPAPTRQYHFSTLVQQTLSVIGQYGGVRANQLWALLCVSGPFLLVDQKLYAVFLRGLGEHELITQTHDGQIILGHRGEKLIEHYTFYTAFSTPEEFRLECDGRVLGTIPIDKPLVPGQLIIFAGKRWEVLYLDEEKRLIGLKRSVGGRPPKFGGEGEMVHDIVRKEMLRVYKQKSIPIYLDNTAKSIFNEGLENFHFLGLEKNPLIPIGTTVHIISWLGDQITLTLSMLLRSKGLKVNCFGGIIDVSNSSIREIQKAVDEILSCPKPTSAELASALPDVITVVEKHDRFLPKELRDLEYGTKYFDVDGAWQWMKKLQKT